MGPFGTVGSKRGQRNELPNFLPLDYSRDPAEVAVFVESLYAATHRRRFPLVINRVNGSPQICVRILSRDVCYVHRFVHVSSSMLPWHFFRQNFAWERI